MEEKLEYSSIIITDCGSTTTKAIWFKKKDLKWEVSYQAEAPTTVEKPIADVTIGVTNSFKNLEKLSGLELLKDKVVDSRSSGNFDLYLTTSSAGGGLQIIVLGIMSNLSTKSATKAALSGGAIVLSQISLDDELSFFERIKILKDQRPDIILLAGGTENGGKEQVRELVEILLSSESKNRFSTDSKIPVIYAGTSEIIEELGSLLENNFSLTSVANLMPSINSENLHPAREAIHDVFLSHVMSQAPGYSKLVSWSDKEIIPTPVAVSKIIETAAKNLSNSILACDIGGATTDIFSVRKFKDDNKELYTECERSVSANLGMSYSIGNVLKNTTIERIIQWLPFEANPKWVREVIWNKMYRPTSLPDTMKELLLEQAVAREALRLSFKHHSDLVGGIENKKEKGLSSFFKAENDNNFKIEDIDFILGSGGVISHAPSRASATLMLLDAFQPRGVTYLAVDSIFMLPHLGSLSLIDERASLELFLNSCIIPLGTVISPIFIKPKSTKIAEIIIQGRENVIISYNELKTIDLAPNKSLELEIIPLIKNVDFGAGLGKKHKIIVKGGDSGVIFDTRNLDSHLKLERKDQINNFLSWQKNLNILV